MQRLRLLPALAAVLLAATLLTAESWLPGQLFAPLTLDDFPGWSAGRPSGELVGHPHPNWTMSDVLHLLVPGLVVTREALGRGELPLWDPGQALGLPHLDQVHYSVLYPPAWIPLALGLRGLGWLAWLHLLVAGVGTLLYLNALGRSVVAAATGALAFACSAWITARLHAFPVVGAAVWLPWVLYGLERGAQQGLGRHHVLAAAALGLSLLAGFPQVTLLVGGVAVLVELGRALSRREGALRRGGLAAGALALGGALAAVQVLPTLDYMSSESARADQDPAALAAEGLELPLLSHLIAPDYYADAGLAGPHPVALGALDQATLPVMVNRPEVSMGVGVAGLLLALLSMLFGRTWVSRTWTGLVLAVFVLLLWPTAFELAASWLPPLRFGNPKRLLLLSTFGLAVLAAGGVDLLRREHLRFTSSGWILALVATAWAVLLLVGVPSSSTSEDIDSWAVSLGRQHGLAVQDAQQVYEAVPIAPEAFARAGGTATRSALVALAVSLAAVVLFRPRATRTQQGWTSHARQAPVLLAGVVGLELVVVALPLLRPAPEAGLAFDPTSIDGLQPPPLVDLVAATAPDPRVPARLARVGDEPAFLRPNFPEAFGLRDLQAYAPMVPARVQELVEALAPGAALSGSAIGGLHDAEELASPLLDMLGVSAVLTQDATLQAEGWLDAGVVGHVRVLANDEVLPPAWCVADQLEVVVAENRLKRLTAPDFDPLAEVILERAVELPGGSLDEPVEDSQEDPLPEPLGCRAVRVEGYRPGSMEFAVGPGPACLLVVAETWHPAWVARVGDRELRPLTADHAIMAVPLPAGSGARVELSFAPDRHLTGALVSGLALLAGLALLVLSLRRRPEPPA